MIRGGGFRDERVSFYLELTIKKDGYESCIKLNFDSMTNKF